MDGEEITGESIACAADDVSATHVDAQMSARLNLARGLLHMRHLRLELFNRDYFGEAAFDMLLDLYVCHREGRTVFQNDAYIASLVPPATAHRWLQTLQRDGLVVLSGDRRDRRRTIVNLTPLGCTRIEMLFDAWLAIRDSVAGGAPWA
ncbi:MarR family winged helix-turn-helix transcriptional regulator [Sphingomonas sp. LaA6.9]|uniref:MarR family winged helix-turn-helix transcriptional regulator n=1 Tax=Sphingomonas sp. LaA6.9 TaxID=2919914 RepID=UPI001F4FF8AE|nr:MarR family winged helix-turn-helix transcriptional regulator [Sphingomonas sp. LaA6.9]MCJ8156679.1 MarR family winged helix-turn-helix transcriptional regulator [Sphingomonas sp. LaA6.9]